MLFRSLSLNHTNYTPVSDLTVVALCFVILVLLVQTHVRKDNNFKRMMGMLAAIVVTALSNVTLQMLITSGDTIRYAKAIYIARELHNISVIAYMYLHISYLREPLWLNDKTIRLYRIATVTLLACFTLSDVVMTFLNVGFRVGRDGKVATGVNLFIPLYGLFLVLVLFLIIRYRDRLVKQIFHGLLAVNLLSWFLMFSQGLHRQQSFTTAAYFFPIIGLFFIFHSNPYDVDTGAVSSSYLYQELEENLSKDHKVLIMSCYMVGFDKFIKESKELKLEFYDFLRQNMRRGVLYRFPHERLIMTIPVSDHKDHRFQVEKMLSDFGRKHKKFNMDYKIVICEMNERITRPHDYPLLIEFVEASMSLNTVNNVNDDDIDKFFDSRYIINQLDDIVNTHDLNDSRVLLYLQPVYNLTTGTYDTAEALMRLRLDDLGLVFPDKFIPLAEQNGQIHTLSLIILNKTCRIIKYFNSQGLDIKRISVNFSAIDLKYDTFCNEVREIITMNGIPFEKIAVEITESRNEQDFNLIKRKILELQSLGIKFYLDDFGTGYSNFERIMELPFDIIKFDRSLLVEMGKNYSSEYMVSTFAGMFNKLGYAVLFEGVENDKDERNCVRMKAGYLQGYKYSKPIPAETAVTFLQPLSNSQTKK
ncbi:EAL domain, c-di-GMP-specific phosphodiesterase class I (or its enzymatically inactive variant) [Ruminococcus sp. YE71]|uniref:EAL domain-containing protein n=1 Tax=unclassified Ruminococcus TaxID=2608920 RepID=UPI000891C72B|nr:MULTISPECIES: EAL domain-containing protein [unclassified Ruminococcus]SDA11874.1 EAL domain, c-di-GMP-specific phosphodiesterase class I (or its enzymatically inactive variant) [Ruminococcus sp. YE78]SFW15893.1 EAL domain, c-di-GMP-specific phosphodiesterase class I (or its enzymatically inactive variant) [Ruminococcus sp. YE71]